MTTLALAPYSLPLPLPPNWLTTKPVFAHIRRSGGFLVDDGGLRQIFLATRAQLARFLIARGNSRDDAEDLLQDMFVKLESSSLGPIAQPRAYLYQMANNLAHDKRRAASRRTNRNEAWIKLQHGGLSETDPAPNAERIVLARDHLSRIEIALDNLPERTADIFKRFRIEGESQKTIASSLGISLSAVEKHLQRAYHALLEARTVLDPGQNEPARIRTEGAQNA